VGGSVEQPQLYQQSQDEDLGHHRSRTHDSGAPDQGHQLSLFQKKSGVLVRVCSSVVFHGFSLRLHGLLNNFQVVEELGIRQPSCAIDHHDDDKPALADGQNSKNRLIQDK
jgi:hypothetical protein